MNNQVKKVAQLLNADIEIALIKSVTAMMGACDHPGESIDAMGLMIEVLERQHQSTVYATIGALVEMAEDTDLPAEMIRKLAHECIRDFETNLMAGLIESYPQVFDGNGRVWEDILNEI